MKVILSIWALLMVQSLYSNTIEVAESLYATRSLTGENAENSRLAAGIYHSLSKNQPSKLATAKMLIKQSEALYFDALRLPDSLRKRKMKIFWSAYEVALEAANLLGNRSNDRRAPVSPTKEEYSKTLANAMYWLSSNAARWGQIKGPFTALKKWSNIVKPRIKDMLAIHPTVMSYGVNRIAGGALNLLGGKINGRNALSFLQEAYNKTVHEVEGIETADNMATNTFLLEAYRKNKMISEYCDLYDVINEIMEEGDDLLSQAFPDLVPEAHYEYGKFKRDKNFKKYYIKKCE
jgi:hypothetical protein